MKSKIYVYIDGQNLILGTKKSKYKWNIDLRSFYHYLENKFRVKKAFYFIGVKDKKFEKLHKYIESCGFIVRFREHIACQKSHKKGNVDTDIIFDIMKRFYESPNSQFILVTQDGDYIKLVKHLIKHRRLIKIIFPNAKKASVLYRKLHTRYWMDLSTLDLIRKLGKRSSMPPGARGTVSPKGNSPQDPRLGD